MAQVQVQEQHEQSRLGMSVDICSCIHCIYILLLSCIQKCCWGIFG